MIANKRRTFHFSYPTIALKTLFRRRPFLRIHILSVFDERPNVHSLVSAHKSDVWMLRHAPHTNTLALGATKFRTIVVLVKKMCQSIFHRKLAAAEAVYSTDRRAGQISYSCDVAGCTKNLFTVMKINGYWCLADEKHEGWVSCGGWKYQWHRMTVKQPMKLPAGSCGGKWKCACPSGMSGVCTISRFLCECASV